MTREGQRTPHWQSVRRFMLIVSFFLLPIVLDYLSPCIIVDAAPVSQRGVSSMDVWLHEAVGDESGWSAWCLGLLGFATWAPTESEVLARVPTKLTEHRNWLARHGIEAPPSDRSIRVVERVRGDEVMFSRDAGPCEIGELDLALRLLSASRKDLLEAVSSLPSRALDWDPPYRSFAAWATWRTVRAILAHVANTETHYYLPSIGHRPRSAPAEADGDWAEFLPRHRQDTMRFLEGIRTASDRARVSRDGGSGRSARSSDGSSDMSCCTGRASSA